MLPWLLPFCFALLWGSSYAAAKIGLADITPFLFVTVRLAIAAIAAGALLLARRSQWSAVGRRWPHLLVGGALVHGLALTTTHAALVSVGAASVALVHAFHPILTAALGVLLLGERFRASQWVGVAVGFFGVVIGVPLSAGGGALVMLGLSLAGLSGGTLYLKRFCRGVPPFEATAVQLIGGALLAGLATVALETPHVHWTMSLAAAMAWNTLLMSVGGMALYNFILVHYGAGRAASSFFVVPGGAALIAHFVLHEHLSGSMMLGLFAASVGVALVWWPAGSQTAKPDRSSASPATS